MAASMEGKKLPGSTFPEEAGMKTNMYTNTLGTTVISFVPFFTGDNS